MFKVEINTSGAAFRDENGEGPDPNGYELCRILRRIIQQIETGSDGNTLMDSNGNKVGAWSNEED